MIKNLYEPFFEWAGTGSLYIISDTHFGDSDCKLMDNNWVDPKTQIKYLDKYKCDTLVHLGDVGDASWIDKIKCRRKILITGNHDTPSNVNGHFTEIYNGPLLIAPRILLSHEPIYGLTWCINIHGHDHAGEHLYYDKYGAKHLNMAANVCGYKPISLGQEIKNGLLKDVEHIHRLTIDDATERKKERLSYEQLTLDNYENINSL